MFAANRSDPALFSFADERKIRLDERGRIARELHDSTSQLLVALELQIMRLRRDPAVATSTVFKDIAAELRSTIAELHEEVRAVTRPDLSPAALHERLGSMASEFEARTGIEVQMRIEAIDPSLPPQTAHTLYRVAQEALANVSRHAGATKVRLSLAVRSRSIELRIADDGVGFSLSPAAATTGRGLDNMRTRLSEIGGSLTLTNLKGGALVSARIGIDRAAAVQA